MLHDKYWLTKKQVSWAIKLPLSEEELEQRAASLHGRLLGELATLFSRYTGQAWNWGKNKGSAGALVEWALGASAGNKAYPDFPQLGIELKTIPVDNKGKARESTFVCTLNMNELHNAEWKSSRVWKKLQCVLWIPIEAEKKVPLADRHIGPPLLWRPTSLQEAQLQADWQSLMGQLAIGNVEGISARQGKFLQIRPKGKNGIPNVEAYGPEGESVLISRRGFYLRAHFTEGILSAR